MEESLKKAALICHTIPNPGIAFADSRLWRPGAQPVDNFPILLEIPNLDNSQQFLPLKSIGLDRWQVRSCRGEVKKQWKNLL